MRAGEVPGSVWAPGASEASSHSGGGSHPGWAGPRCLPFEFSNCLKWVLWILLPRREVGHLRKSVFKIFISRKLSGRGQSPFIKGIQRLVDSWFGDLKYNYSRQAKICIANDDNDANNDNLCGTSVYKESYTVSPDPQS